MNARHYDPGMARFLEVDTYTGELNDPLSLNLYTYCHNEPLMYSDPSGHYDESHKLSWVPGVTDTSLKSADVVELQKDLIYLGFMKDITQSQFGYFGEKTHDAVNRFKDEFLKNGNTGNNRGVVGPTTWVYIKWQVGIKDANAYSSLARVAALDAANSTLIYKLRNLGLKPKDTVKSTSGNAYKNGKTANKKTTKKVSVKSFKKGFQGTFFTDTYKAVKNNAQSLVTNPIGYAESEIISNGNAAIGLYFNLVNEYKSLSKGDFNSALEYAGNYSDNLTQLFPLMGIQTSFGQQFNTYEEIMDANRRGDIEKLSFLGGQQTGELSEIVVTSIVTGGALKGAKLKTGLTNKKAGHSLQWEHLDTKGTSINNGSVDSGGSNLGRRLSWEEQSITHTERKVVEMVKSTVQKGDTIIMKGTKPPCNPGRSTKPSRGCQKAMQDLAKDKGVNILYFVEGEEMPWIFPR